MDSNYSWVWGFLLEYENVLELDTGDEICSSVKILKSIEMHNFFKIKWMSCVVCEVYLKKML